MKFQWYAVIAAVLAAALAGCGRSPSADPKGTFAALARRFVPNLQDEFDAPIGGQKYLIPSTYFINIHKPDSPASPYVGVIDMDISVENEGESSGSDKYEAAFTFAIRDDKWVLRSAVLRSTRIESGPHAARRGVEEETFDWMTQPGADTEEGRLRLQRAIDKSR